MRARVGALAANKFTKAIQHSTIALTWFRSGVGDPPKINVIPSVAEAGLDCRVLPGTTRGQWMTEIGRRLDPHPVGAGVAKSRDRRSSARLWRPERSICSDCAPSEGQIPRGSMHRGFPYAPK